MRPKRSIKPVSSGPFLRRHIVKLHANVLLRKSSLATCAKKKTFRNCAGHAIYAFLLSMAGNCLSVSINAVAAENNNSSASPWQLTGKVLIAAAVINSTDPLFVDDKNKRISRLDSNASTFSSTSVFPFFNITYTNSTVKTKYYVRTPIEKELPLAVGGAQDIPGWGTADVSAFTNLHDFAWKDPYVTDQSRDKTQVAKYGVTLRFNDFYYTWTRQDVADDVIGERFSELKRDGQIHKLGYTPAIVLNQTSMVTIGLDYSREALQGRSEKSNNYSVSVEYQREQSRYAVNMFLKAKKSFFDGVHPIFGKKPETLSYSARLILTWLDPLGYKDFFSGGFVNYDCSDSNIRFFSSCTGTIGIGTGYRFRL
jgi:hypothetical protein